MTRTALAPLVVAIALGAAPALAGAQPPPPAPDRAWGRMDVQQDHRELADDRWDLARIEQLLARFDAARAWRDRRALAAVEGEVLRFLDRELHEAQAEIRRAATELRRDGRDGWRDPCDDRRDWRDDRRDLVRVKAIRAEFWSLRGRTERRALERKRALVAELAHLARAELREDRTERREDWRGLRADTRW